MAQERTGSAGPASPLDLFRPAEQWWPLPQVAEVVGGRLEYVLGSLTMAGDGDPGAAMLERFLALRDATDKEIRDYSYEFGVLGLCHHNFPANWDHPREDLRVRCAPLPINYSEDMNRYGEPLAAWRNMARALQTLLDAASRVEKGRRLPRSLLDQLARFNGGGRYLSAEDLLPHATESDLLRQALPMDRQALSDALNHLLNDAVRVQVAFPGGAARPKMVFRGSSLADSLVIQIAQSVCRVGSSATCDACGMVFVPTPNQVPRIGQINVFCAACRADGQPQKFADRRRRAKNRAARQAAREENSNG